MFLLLTMTVCIWKTNRPVYAFVSACAVHCGCTCLRECIHGYRTTPWTHTTLKTKHREKERRLLEGFSLLWQCSTLFKTRTVMTVDHRVKSERSDSSAGLQAIPAHVAAAKFEEQSDDGDMVVQSLCWSFIWSWLEQTHLPLGCYYCCCYYWPNSTPEMLLSVQMPEIVLRGWDLYQRVELPLAYCLWLILWPETNKHT